MQIKKCENKIFVWLGLSHLTCDIYTGFLNPVMPFIASNLGFTMAVATVLISISQICSNMLQPIFGFFADNISKRFFVFWGLILVSVFIPLTTHAPNVFLLTVFMVLGCLGSSFFHPQSTGFINLFSNDDCSDKMGYFIGMGTFGYAFGPFLAALITQFFGLKFLPFTSILGLLLAGLMFTSIPKLSSLKLEIKHHDFVKTFKDIITNSQIVLLIVIAMMKSLITNCVCVLLPFLWKDSGHSPFYIGSALALFIFLGGVSSILSPKIEKKVGSKSVIYFSLTATLPLLILYFCVYKFFPVLSMIIFALIGFTTMLAQPVVLVWSQQILPQYKSVISGFINGFCWGVVALFLASLGTFAQHFGIIRVIIIVALIPFFSAYLVKYLKKQKT